MDNTNMNQGSGAKIATVLVIIIILIGAWYFWSNRTPSATPGNQSAVSGAATDTAAAIEADLNTTNVDNADQNLNDASVNAS